MNAFLSSEYPQSAPEEALFHVIPAPLEATVSYGGGTAKGPAAILAASDQLEADNGVNAPGEKGFYTAPAIPLGKDQERNIALIREAVERTLRVPGRHLPVVLGGEHSVTYPVLQALTAARGGGIGVVQIDAHADLRDSYEGTPYSHACVMRRLHADLGIPLVQLGTRAYCREEREYREAHRDSILALDGRELESGNVRELKLPDWFPEKLYVSVDVDGLDPSIMPATGTPVPGGLGWWQAIDLLASVASQREMVGFDVVEFAPIPGLHFADFACADLVHKLMGLAI
ncbi:MAG: agmatinase [Fibrobacterales bacterium]|nr:agmatinase [Fibrobacterales bacterium]